MSFISNNLLADEKIIYFIKPHWIVFSSGAWAIFFAIMIAIAGADIFSISIIGGWSLNAIASIILLFIGLYWLIQGYIYFVTSEYGVTNKRVVIKTGWIERKSLEVLLDKVEGVLVDQSLIGRLLNYGSITVIGTGGTKDAFPFIPNPLLFRKMAQEQIVEFESATSDKKLS